jgi:hypothetical protein
VISVLALWPDTTEDVGVFEVLSDGVAPCAIHSGGG